MFIRNNCQWDILSRKAAIFELIIELLLLLKSGEGVRRGI